MAVAKNDNKILKLKDAIKKKKEAIQATERFTPVTNCLLSVEGEPVNLNVLGKDDLITALVYVNTQHMSALALGIQNSYKPSGFTTDDWMTDIQARLNILVVKDERVKLKLLESKLHTLLSADKKVELELEELANEVDSL